MTDQKKGDFDPRVEETTYCIMEALFGSVAAGVTMSNEFGHFLVVPSLRHMDKLIEMGAKPSRVVLGSELAGGAHITDFLVDEAVGIIEFTDEEEE